MLTYSEDGLTTASTAYCNSGYTSIRKCAYTFDILLSTNVPYTVLRVKPPSRKTRVPSTPKLARTYPVGSTAYFNWPGQLSSSVP
jgi:hypothetical protein